MICLQAPKALVDGLQNGFLRQTDIIGAVAHFAADFAGQDYLIAPPFERFADDGFRQAAVVHIGGVDEVDAGFQGAVDHADGGGFVGLRAERHSAETGARNVQVSVMQGAAFHSASLPKTRFLAETQRTQRKPSHKYFLCFFSVYSASLREILVVVFTALPSAWLSFRSAAAFRPAHSTPGFLARTRCSARSESAARVPPTPLLGCVIPAARAEYGFPPDIPPRRRPRAGYFRLRSDTR